MAKVIQQRYKNKKKLKLVDLTALKSFFMFKIISLSQVSLLPRTIGAIKELWQLSVNVTKYHKYCNKLGILDQTLSTNVVAFTLPSLKCLSTRIGVRW